MPEFDVDAALRGVDPEVAEHFQGRLAQQRAFLDQVTPRVGITSPTSIIGPAVYTPKTDFVSRGRPAKAPYEVDLKELRTRARLDEDPGATSGILRQVGLRGFPQALHWVENADEAFKITLGRVPDKEAKIQFYASLLPAGLGTDFVRDNFEAVERDYLYRDFRELAKDSRTLAEWAANPDNITLAWDSGRHLSALKNVLVSRHGGTGEHVAVGFQKVLEGPKRGLVDTLRILDEASNWLYIKTDEIATGQKFSPEKKRILAKRMSSTAMYNLAVLAGHPWAKEEMARIERLSPEARNLYLESRPDPLRAKSVELRETADQLTDEVGGFYRFAVDLPGSVADLTTKVVQGMFNPALPLGIIAMQEGGSTYAELRDQGVSGWAAISAALPVAGINVLLERAQLNRVRNLLGIRERLSREALGTIIRRSLLDVTENIVQETAQNMVTTAGTLAGRATVEDLTLKDAYREMAGSLKEGLYEGFLVGASSAILGMASLGSGMRRVAINARQRAAFEAAIPLIEKTPLYARDPAKLQEAVDAMLAGKDASQVIRDVGIDAQTFEQMVPEALREQALTALGVDAETYSQALNADEEIRFTTGAWVTVAPTEIGTQLFPHIRLGADGMSLAEQQQLVDFEVEVATDRAEIFRDILTQHPEGMTAEQKLGFQQQFEATNLGREGARDVVDLLDRILKRGAQITGVPAAERAERLQINIDAEGERAVERIQPTVQFVAQATINKLARERYGRIEAVGGQAFLDYARNLILVPEGISTEETNRLVIHERAHAEYDETNPLHAETAERVLDATRRALAGEDVTDIVSVEVVEGLRPFLTGDRTYSEAALLAEAYAQEISRTQAERFPPEFTFEQAAPERVEYPTVEPGATVDGREVLPEVPNQSSISASLEEYEILPGIREVPMLDFPGLTGRSYSADENERIGELATAIEDSKEISPLIVVVDAEGPYILEGGHRADALYRLGAKSFPAMVVLDRRSVPTTTTTLQREMTPIGGINILGVQTTFFQQDPEKWRVDQTQDIFSVVNNRLGKELEVVERLLGPLEEAAILPGRGGEPQRSITAYDLGQVLFRARKSGLLKRLVDPSVDPRQLADARGLKGVKRKAFLAEVKELRSGSLYLNLDERGRPVLSANGKATSSVDLALATCQPTTPCKECYAAASMIRMSAVRKALRSTIHILLDPQDFGRRVAAEAGRVPKTQLPFIRLLGSGDMTSTETVEAFNAIAEHADRPIHIFSRHHDNLAKLKGTQTAPFIKMGSVDAELYAHYGAEYLKQNLEKRGINNCWLYTDPSELGAIRDLAEAGALGLILSADKKLHADLSASLRQASCPCDAGERSYMGSCRQCALSTAGCFMAFADKGIDQQGDVWSLFDEKAPAELQPVLQFLTGYISKKKGRTALAEAYGKIAADIAKKSIELIQLYRNQFLAGDKVGVTVKDLRWPNDAVRLVDRKAHIARERAAGRKVKLSELRNTANTIYTTRADVLASVEAEIERQRGIQAKALNEGTFELPGGEIQAPVVFANWQKVETLEQREGVTRGAVTFRGQNIEINLFKGTWDKSTPIHELGHIALRFVQDAVESGTAGEELIAEYETLLSHAGGILNTEGVEKIMAAWEAYFMEGKAPAVDLTDSFARFKNWMVDIYQTVKNKLGGQEKVAPDLRQVFNAWLASESEVELAEAYYRTYETASDILLKEKDNKLEQAKDKAQDEREKQIREAVKLRLAEWMEKTGGRAGILAQATAEIDALPIYQALGDAIKLGGINQDDLASYFTGADLQQMIDSLRIKHGKDVVASDAKPPLNKTFDAFLGWSTDVDRRSDLETVADRHAFADPRAMVLQMKESPSRQEAIETRANDIEARHVRFIRAEVEADTGATHNEATLDLIMRDIARLEALERGRVSDRLRRAKLKALRQQTRDELRKNLNIRDASQYKRWAAREAEYARKAVAAARRGDGPATLDARRRQLKFHVAIIEAIAIRDEYAKRSRQMSGRVIEGRLKNVEPDYANAARDLIFSFRLNDTTVPSLGAVVIQEEEIEGVKRHQLFDRQAKEIIGVFATRGEALTAWRGLVRVQPLTLPSLGMTEKDDSDLRGILLDLKDIVPTWVQEKQTPAGYLNTKDLTFEQYEELVDSVQAILHEGSHALTALKTLGVERVEEILDRMLPRIEKLPDFKKRDPSTALGRAGTVSDKFAAYMTKMEFLFDAMDGYVTLKGEKAGPAGLIYDLMSLADSNYDNTLQKHMEGAAGIPGLQQAYVRLAKAAERVNAQRGEFFDIPGVPIPAVLREIKGWRAWTFERVLAVVFNMGNDANRGPLQKSVYQFTDEQLDALASVLPSDALRAVQDVWDSIDVYDDLAKVTYNVTFQKPPKEEPMAFTVVSADGEEIRMRGGYYPLRYDGDLDPDAARWNEWSNVVADLFNQTTHQRARPDSTASKARVRDERTGESLSSRPPDLSLGVLVDRFTKTVRQITHMELLYDLQRLTTNRDFYDVFVRKFGLAQYKQMRQWLNRTARPERKLKGPMNRVIETLRGLHTVSALGLRVITSGKQALSAANAVQAMNDGAGDLSGYRYLASGVSAFITNPTEIIEYVQSVDPFMKARASSVTREMRDFTRKIDFAKGGFLNKVKQSRQWCMEVSFLGIRAVDAMTTYSVWMGAYKQALDLGLEGVAEAKNEDEAAEAAIRYARRICRTTQPTGLPVDLAGVQAEEGVARLFTQFMSFKSVDFNRFMHRVAAVKRGQIGSSKMIGYIINERLIPAMALLIPAYLFYHDDEEPKWWEFFIQPGTDLLAGVPLLNQAIGTFQYGRVAEIPIMQGITRARKSVDKFRRGKVGEGAYEAWRTLEWFAGVPFTNPIEDARRLYKKAKGRKRA